MTPPHASVAAFVVELPADRFVEDLFPSLAWTATVRLADPVISSRLVERVLRKAWDEREQFATPELLYQHARHAARSAIETEAEHRFATVRFDDAASMQIPGDLQAMSVQAVQRRLQAMTPTEAAVRAVPTAAGSVAAVPVAAVPVAAVPNSAMSLAPVPAPTVTPVNALAAPAQARAFAASTLPSVTHDRVTHDRVTPDRVTAALPSGQQPLHAPLTAPVERSVPALTVQPAIVPPSDARATRESRPTVAKWASKSAGARDTVGAAGVVAPKGSRAPRGRHRRTPSNGFDLHLADYIARAGGVRMSPQIIGGLGVIAMVALIVVWRSLSSTPANEQAIAALADTLGVSSATKQGQGLDVRLPGGGSVYLGPEATLRSSSEFADGARALRVAGPSVVRMAVDSAKPTAIASGTLRWMTYGVSAAFDRMGNDIVVQVDSGALELVGDSTRTRVAAGSSVRVDASAIVTALSAAERDAAFAWRTGRLVLTRASGQRLVEEVNQWFGLAVRFTPALTAAESLSVNVPLSAVDSLSAALGVAVGGTVERNGQQLMVTAAPPPPVVPPKRVSARRSRSDAMLASRPAARRSTTAVVLDDIKLPELKSPTLTARPPR